jgi:hypothetical protein
MSAYVNRFGILIVPARVSSTWPPLPEDREAALRDAFGQHVVANRDWVVRRAYEVLVERQPYAGGRVHQRPFATLDELGLDDQTRDKLVDVVAVFVDDAITHTLSLLGAATNIVNGRYRAEYELRGRATPGAVPPKLRDVRGGESDTDDEWDAEEAAREERDLDEEIDREESDAAEEEPFVSLGPGLGWAYRTWLRTHSTFRPTARPSRL